MQPERQLMLLALPSRLVGPGRSAPKTTTWPGSTNVWLDRVGEQKKRQLSFLSHIVVYLWLYEVQVSRRVKPVWTHPSMCYSLAVFPHRGKPQPSKTQFP